MNNFYADNYLEIINKVCELINDISINYDNFTVGIGMPGSLHPETGKVQVSNTKALEGQDVKKDLENKLGFEVKIANDADCLAVSESIDGSGKNYDSVFAVIMGTGVGAGYTFRNQFKIIIQIFIWCTFSKAIDPKIQSFYSCIFFPKVSFRGFN